MFSRRAGLVTLAVITSLLVAFLGHGSVSSPVAAQSPDEKAVGAMADMFDSAGQHVLVAASPQGGVGVSISNGTFGITALEPGQFQVDPSLSSASLKASIDAVQCNEAVLPRVCTHVTVSVDVMWESEGHATTGTPPGQVMKFEDCSATLAQAINRDAVVTGTVNGLPVSGTGFIGRVFYPTGLDVPHCR